MQGTQKARGCGGTIAILPLVAGLFASLLATAATAADATGWHGGISLDRAKPGLILSDIDNAMPPGASGSLSSPDRQDTAYKARVGYDFSNGLAVFGKVGVILPDGTDVRALLSDKPGRTFPGVGLGLNYSVTKSLGLRAEWEKYYRLGNDLGGRPDIDQLSIGVNLKFR